MHILILGGTSFVGRAIAVDAVSRKHEVTLFNRGTKSAPEGTKSLIGDRLSPEGLAALHNLTFDAVVDTWSADSTAVIRALEELASRIKHYTFISSANVYERTAIQTGDILNDENTSLFDIDAPEAQKSAYQFNKRSAEAAVETHMGIKHNPALILRPGIILGPHEADVIERGRLTWWLDRLQRGGRTLGPGPKRCALQFIDVRDLAKFVIGAIEKRTGGAYNILNRPGSVTTEYLLETGNKITGQRASFEWKTPQEILEAGIKPFSEIPLWVDPESREYAMLYRWDTTKAFSAGLECRAPAETIYDTWTWMQDSGLAAAPDGYKLPLLGLSSEKEAKLLGLL